MSKAIIIIIAIILIVVGLVWISYTLWRNWKINRISEWPKVNATVVNVLTKVEGKGSDVFIDANKIAIEDADKMRYVPTVLYVYRVNGREYQSTNLVYSGPDDFNAFQTKLLVSELSPGSTVPVFVNPNDASESYIYNGVKNYWGVIGGIIVLIIGIIVYSRVHTKKNKDKYKELYQLTEKFGIDIPRPQYRLA